MCQPTLPCLTPQWELIQGCLLEIQVPGRQPDPGLFLVWALLPASRGSVSSPVLASGPPLRRPSPWLRQLTAVLLGDLKQMASPLWASGFFLYVTGRRETCKERPFPNLCL